jgi:hypothetical protein
LSKAVSGYISLAIFSIRGLYLHGLGIIPDRNTADFVLIDLSGKQLTVALHALDMASLMSLRWIYPFNEPPLSGQLPDKVFWVRYLPESRTVYCNFRGYDGIDKNAAALLES